MKINKYGRVIITEDDIVVIDFDVEGLTSDDFEIWALRWAVQRIAEVRRYKNIQGLLNDLIFSEVSDA